MTHDRATVIIADDEPLARERLRRLLRSEPGFELVGEASDGPGAVRLLEECRPQIAVLDIRLPGLDAFEVLREHSEDPMPAVIFVTAFSDRAVEAFRAGAVDYVTKPFDPARLREALSRARLKRPPSGSEPESADPPQSLLPERIAFRSSGRWVILDSDEIEQIHAANNRAEVVTRGGLALQVQESLGQLEARLPGDRFARVSRFTILNLGAVAAVSPKTHGDQNVELASGRQAILSRNHRAAVLEKLRALR